MNLNKAIIVGRVTANPELRKTQGGTSVTSFSLATNRVWTDKNGAKQEETEFHNIVAWGRQAEIAAQFLTKGALALVEGRLQTRSWQDKQGSTHRTTEIICERLQLGPRAQGSGGGSSFSNREAPQRSPEPASQESPAEEIPIIDVESDSENLDDIPF